MINFFRFIHVILASLATLTQSFGLGNPSGLSEASETIVKSVQELGLDISFNQWQEGNRNDNVVLSPISITSLLGLLLLASEGETHSQLARVLHYPSNMSDPHTAFNEVLDHLETPRSGITLNSDAFGTQIASLRACRQGQLQAIASVESSHSIQ